MQPRREALAGTDAVPLANLRAGRRPTVRRPDCAPGQFSRVAGRRAVPGRVAGRPRARVPRPRAHAGDDVAAARLRDEKVSGGRPVPNRMAQSPPGRRQLVPGAGQRRRPVSDGRCDDHSRGFRGAGSRNGPAAAVGPAVHRRHLVGRRRAHGRRDRVQLQLPAVGPAAVVDRTSRGRRVLPARRGRQRLYRVRGQLPAARRVP